MDQIQESTIRSRKAGRDAAASLTELYIDESARLNAEHGLEASTAFLERLRDNLIAIRPLPTVEPEKPEPRIHESPDGTREWDEREIPDRYVLVTFDAVCEVETDKAVKIGETWIPKSQIHEPPEQGEYVGDHPVTQWFADKEGLQ